MKLHLDGTTIEVHAPYTTTGNCESCGNPTVAVLKMYCENDVTESWLCQKHAREVANALLAFANGNLDSIVE